MKNSINTIAPINTKRLVWSCVHKTSHYANGVEKTESAWYLGGVLSGTALVDDEPFRHYEGGY
jgi:hypothetical protein